MPSAEISNPNRQIRSLVLYVHAVRPRAVGAAQVRCRIQLSRLSAVWLWLVDCHGDCRDPRQQAADYESLQRRPSDNT
jgi:hypothetical protein